MAHGYDMGGQVPEDDMALTRSELAAKAEALAVDLVRWKVWWVEGSPTESLQEAQAMQAVIMALIELLAGAQGSHATARLELVRAMALLGFVVRDGVTEREASLPAPLGAQEGARELHDDVAFLRTYGLRMPDEGDTPTTS